MFSFVFFFSRGLFPLLSLLFWWFIFIFYFLSLWVFHSNAVLVTNKEQQLNHLQRKSREISNTQKNEKINE